jgi:hypothetical protein
MLMFRRRETEEAKLQVRRDAEREALRRELVDRFGDEDDLAQPETSTMSNQAGNQSFHRRATIGSDDSQRANRSKDEVMFELPTMLTPPLTPQSPHSHTASDVHDPHTIIQILQCRLETEEKKRADLEQELEHVKRKQQQHIADRDHTQNLREQAVMDDYMTEAARLQRQVAALKKFLDESREDVTKLEEELRQKDKLISELRMEIRTRMQKDPGQTARRTAEEAGRSSPVRSRKSSPPRMLLRKKETVKEIVKGDNVYNAFGTGAALFV